MSHRVQRCPIAPLPLLTVETHSKIIKKRQCGCADRLNDFIFNVCYHNSLQPPLNSFHLSNTLIVLMSSLPFGSAASSALLPSIFKSFNRNILVFEI